MGNHAITSTSKLTRYLDLLVKFMLIDALPDQNLIYLGNNAMKAICTIHKCQGIPQFNSML